MHLLVHCQCTIEYICTFDSTMYRGLAEFSEFTETVNENRKNSINLPGELNLGMNFE